MKNRWIAGACSLALILGMNSAMAENSNSGTRMGAQLAIADADGLDTGLALVLTGIFPMPQVHPAFTVEAEFTTTVSNPEDSQSTPFGTISAELSYFTLAGYGVWNHPVSPTIKLKGRIGLLYESLEVDFKSPFGNGSDDDTDIGLSYGFGAVFDIKQSIDIIAEYTVIESDISHISAGVQWSF